LGTGSISAVSDAGPLVHLAEINCLPLLSLFERLHIPEAVWLEAVESGRTPELDVLRLGNVQRHTLSQAEIVLFIEENNLKELHTGERECLYLCQQIGVPILLTDDLAVREVAQRLNLRPVGSLGVVVRAHLAGHISLADAEQHITELYEVSSLFISRAIVELAVEQLHKHIDQATNRNK
jgi:predicted nucleic acid-binding protein